MAIRLATAYKTAPVEFVLELILAQSLIIGPNGIFVCLILI